MKKAYYAMLVLILFSCGQNKPEVASTMKSPNGFNYNESLKAWDELKKINGNSYEYEVHFESWIGYESITKLKIVKGKVLSRSFEFYKPDPNTGELNVSSSYFENKDDLGKHEEGALPRTIDQLYTSCLSQYIIADIVENYVYFETDKNGIVNLCGFVPKGCADDCYKGISIDKFSWI